MATVIIPILAKPWQLIKAFKTVKKVKEADIEALSEEVGRKKAEIIINYFKNKEENTL